MALFRVCTNWTNGVSEFHEFTLDDLFDAATRDMLKWAIADPERLQPGKTQQRLTERVAASFGTLAPSAIAVLVSLGSVGGGALRAARSREISSAPFQADFSNRTRIERC